MNELKSPVSQILNAIDFAARKHRFQRRKDKEATPYINHPIEVAKILIDAGESDIALITAALLHDTIEDTKTSSDELKASFGEDVTYLVLEVTDDKSLEKRERKLMQITEGSKKSHRARKLKMADKISNLRYIINAPPADWDKARKLEYVNWSKEVVDQIRGLNPFLDSQFDECFRQALSSQA